MTLNTECSDLQMIKNLYLVIPEKPVFQKDEQGSPLQNNVWANSLAT